MKPANATEALRELVACKDLKDKLDALGRHPVLPSEKAMRNDYERRKPLAWAAARAALAEPPKEVPLAQKMFEGWQQESTAEYELIDLLEAAGLPEDWYNFWWDDYDGSWEFGPVGVDFVMPQACLDVLWKAGFARGWLNFTDDTEIYYQHGSEPSNRHPGRHRERKEGMEARRNKAKSAPPKEVAALIERLQTESDQCRNDGANDIAILLDDAIRTLARLSAPVPELTERERGVLRHALTGGRDVTPYRNHFAASEGHADMPTLRALVARGLMTERKSGVTPDTLFHCTEAGAKAVGLHLPAV